MLFFFSKITQMKNYDCVIIGGGPAGLSAAIYLSRFNRSVVVVDEGIGRWNTHEVNENYLGFPKGIKVTELHSRGVEQAQKFGTLFSSDFIKKITRKNGLWNVQGKKNYYARKIILATGVTDNYPEFKSRNQCLGKSLFWCITCDGYKTIDKTVMVVGSDKEAATTALQFLNFTSKVIVVTNHKPNNTFSTRLITLLKEKDIKIYNSEIKDVTTKDGNIVKVLLANNEEIRTDYMFNLQRCNPNNHLPKSLGVEVNIKGFVLTDQEQRTNIIDIYAAGDITKRYAHQIVSAAHEGATAAQSVNFDLYSNEQQGEI